MALPSPPDSPKVEPAKVDRVRNENSTAIYEPYPLSEFIAETRFFVLKPGKWDDIIECTLDAHALSEDPEYTALSYAWGECAGEPGPPEMETIKLNGYDFNISANLASALRFFRSSHAGSLLWADAICHNQQDDDEMNIQVQRMREIYRKCDELHIWLGKESKLVHPDSRIPANNGSTIVWTSKAETTHGSTEHIYVPSEEDNERVKRYNQKFRKFMSLPTALQVFSKQDFREGAFCLLHILARNDHLVYDAEHPDLQFIQSLQTRDGVFEALKEIMERCWWTRQWVIQETVLSKHVYVHYGGFTLPWIMLSSAQKTIQIHQSKGCCTTEYAKLRTTDLEVLDQFTHTTRAIERWRTVWQNDASASRIQLLPLLWQFRHRSAGRAADKLYALLPLVRDWQAAEHVSPHYEWTDDIIFTNSVSALINVHNSLLPLVGTTKKTQELKGSLPSWAPDWSCRPPTDELARQDRTLLYHASGMLKDANGQPVQCPNLPGRYKLKFDTQKNFAIIGAGTPKRLRYFEIRGLVHDKISVVGSKMPLTDSAKIKETFSQWHNLALKGQNGKYIGHQPYASGSGCRVEAYVRTICMDTEYLGEENDDENLPLDRHDYQRTGPGYAAPLIALVNQVECVDDDQRRMDEADGIRQFERNITWKEPKAPKVRQGGLVQPGLKRRTSTSTSSHEPDTLKAINKAVKTATSERVFFITERGYMGLGPAHLRKGDEVAVLAGGHTPFVLRRTKEHAIDKRRGVKQCHILVGDCYVHGLMDGEAVASINSREELQQLFLE